MKRLFKILPLLSLLFVPGMLSAQNELIIKGTVTNKMDSEETLIGVTVQEVDPSNRILSMTITDYNGQFVLKVKSEKNKLIFSYIGFKKLTIGIEGKKELNVSMEEESLSLKDAVVTAQRMTNNGSGLQVPEREVGMAMQTISTAEFEGLQVGTLDEALQGRVAGLDIVSVSGNPGSGSSMRIRGTSSITGNHEPLIVMNGVPYETNIEDFDFANSNEEDYANMLSINPDDILEITVLKDAASTAIWGSKGANGVLMVTTKKGKAGPTNVQYSYRFTRAVQPQSLNMLSGDDYTMMIKQAYFNPRQDENASNVDEYNYDQSFTEYENFNNNTDWVSAVSQVGYTHDNYLSLSGGGDRASFRVTAGYYDQTGTVINQHLRRFSTRAYLEYRISDRLRAISDFSYTYSDNQRNYEDLLSIAYRKMPNVSIYEQNIDGSTIEGKYYNIPNTSRLDASQRDMHNPVAIANLGVNNLKNFRILPTFRLQYDFTGDHSNKLKYEGYVSFDINNNKNSGFLPWNATNVRWDSSSANSAKGYDSESLTIYTDQNITYSPRFSNTDHALSLYGSFQANMGNSGSQSIGTYGLTSTTAQDASNEGYLSELSSGRSSWRSVAFLAQAHYAYQSKYVLSLVMRTDGSTQFGSGNRFGNFPGVSARWNISDEPWMDWSDGWLDMLSLRPSWGISGQQPGREYLHYSRYAAYDSYLGEAATRPSSLKLNDLRWAKTSSWNIGTDIELFGSKLVFDINFYHKRTEDMLFSDIALPSTSGYGSLPQMNAGTMDNDGWEFNVFTNKVVSSGKFSLDFNFNISNYVNTIVELDQRILDVYNTNYDYTNGTYLTRLQEGHSFGSIYGFRYLGTYMYDYDDNNLHAEAPVAYDASGNIIVDEKGKPLPMVFAAGTTKEYQFRGGDAKYEDVNHDGSIDELDIVYLGNCNPLFNGGFGVTLRYGKLSLNAFFNYRYGNKVINAARMNAENMYYDNNQSIAVNWRWRKDGDDTAMPRALHYYGYNWLGSDRFVEDASFLRLKYLTIRYSFPKEWFKAIGIKSLDTYLTLNNLFCLTKYTGVDPEVGYGSFGLSTDNAQTPRSKSFTASVTVTF